MSQSKTTVNDKEVAHFDAIAGEWWDRDGKYKILHKMNPSRIRYIQRVCGEILDKRILDVGCGGGLVSVPLARLGAKVTAIDASPENIRVASTHASDIDQEIDFRNIPLEKLKDKDFDIIIALEIIEHVDNPELFMAELSRRLKKGGKLVMSTVNKTVKSMLFAKLAAEYVLRIVPIGTHDWAKFLPPKDLEDMACKHNLCKIDECGLSIAMPFFEFYESKDTSINYFMSFEKL